MVHACPFTITAGSYVLGVLSPLESNEFHQHTEECPYCRREVLELSPVVGFLASLKAERRWASPRWSG
jgi:anti-sigma factor RsiW